MYCGEKVRLRAYKEEDIPLATKFVNDRELKKLLVTNIPFPMTNWEEESWIKSQKSNDNGQYNFAIEDIETGKYIGGCGIQNVNWLSRVALVGIMIGDKDYWGKGYGTDAMKTLVTFIFNNMNSLRGDNFNNAVGVLKNEIFKDGKYYDEIIMSIFKD